MKKIILFFKNLQFIFRPSFWYMKTPYCEIWDKKLNYLLDKYEFTKIDWCKACLGDNLIWVGNYPYSCFILYSLQISNHGVRASKLTILRAKKKIGKLPRYPNFILEELNNIS